MADDEEIPADIRRMTFEEAIRSLEAIVQRLEAGDVSLEESIATYTRGTQLKRHCEAKLTDARKKVERIELGPGGAAAVELD